MRKLASIQEIKNLEPITNADAIEKATVLGWQLVVKKGEFKIGDLCVFCEIDSILPDKPEFEFLRERKFRIKTIRLRGQISQGICFPLSILPSNYVPKIGDDVTKLLEITQYDPDQQVLSCTPQKVKFKYPEWMPRWLCLILNKIPFVRYYYKRHSKDKSFPSVLVKTDQTRVQILQPLLDKYQGTQCCITEKLDGSSITVYLIDGKFGVCSRNLDLFRNSKDKYWATVLKLNIEEKMRLAFPNQSIAFQGELVGPGVRGNKYNLPELDIYFFDIFDINHHEYLVPASVLFYCQEMNLKNVPFLSCSYMLHNNIQELVEMSKGQSLIAAIPREGIVIRPYDKIIIDHFDDFDLIGDRVSFKSVNPEFLLKYGE